MAPAKAAKRRQNHRTPTGLIPTPERMRQDPHRLQEVEKNGARVQVNLEVTPVDRLFNRGKIVAREKEAGLKFGKRWHILWASSGRRDTLDLTPRGGSSEPDPVKMLALKDDYEKLIRKIGIIREGVLRDVCALNQPVGDARRQRHSLLLEALDIAADHWGYPRG